jgi:hypothetical protein
VEGASRFAGGGDNEEDGERGRFLVGAAERGAGNGLHACDFKEGVDVRAGLDFTSVLNDVEPSVPFNCGVFENDRVADFGPSELLGAPEWADPTKSHRRCNNDEDMAIKILTGR